jgi:hypothetical protein
MDRRDVLRAVAGVTAAGVAGCASDGPGGHPPTENESATGTETEPDNTRISEVRLEPTESECGQQMDIASITVDAKAGEVRVTGTIWGSDTSKLPVLDIWQYDPDDDELSLRVTTRAEETEETAVSLPCIVELDYELTAAFAGPAPGSVQVVHDHGDGGQVVAEA